MERIIEFTVKDLIYAESLNILVSIDFKYQFGSVITLEKRYSSQNNNLVEWRRKKIYNYTTLLRDNLTLRDIINEFEIECAIVLQRYLAEEVYHYEQNTVSGTGSDGSSNKAP